MLRWAGSRGTQLRISGSTWVGKCGQAAERRGVFQIALLIVFWLADFLLLAVLIALELVVC